MTLLEILLLSLSLSADSFVVSMSGSVSLGRPSFEKSLSVASVFAVVQAAFLFVGWLAGHSVVAYLSKVAHVMAFLILAYIGGTMVVSSFRKEEAGNVDIAGTRHLMAAAVASSIDAFAVGISLAMADMDVRSSVLLTSAVFAVTLLASCSGVHAGAAAGRKFGRAAKAVGGIILIFIGCKPFL